MPTRKKKSVPEKDGRAAPLATSSTTSGFPDQELFLPVSGFVRLYPEELAVVDHPSFQRLRRLRQLGFAHYVFPGATHTRFEHSIGTLHVAQKIIDSINENYRRSNTGTGRSANQPIDSTPWEISFVGENEARLIRLAALLHDIGHLPFGHTLEDELSHLRPHDGLERLRRVSTQYFQEYVIDPKLPVDEKLKHSTGWKLEDLINELFARFVQDFGGAYKAFDVLSHIICKKPPRNDESQITESWAKAEEELSRKLQLKVAQDIVGNTICADFLDYIYRDWFHIGKPFFADERLFQYFEVRAPRQNSEEHSGQQAMFLVNAGESNKIRHDALTIT
jgi:HD superfamily phosphohydrolase